MQAAITIIHGLGVMALITIGYGMIQRMPVPRLQRHLILGTLFGGGAVVAMLEPMALQPGLIVDTRNLYVAFAGAFLGPIGTLAASVIAVAVRLGIGGVGAAYGVISILISAIIGLAWARPDMTSLVRMPQHFALMGASVTVSLIVVPFVPGAPANVWPVISAVFVFNVIGATLFGTMLMRERRLARRERSLRERAEQDPLTRVLNRRGFTRQYEAIAAQTRHHPAALLVIDLDHFKRVNDTFGHAVGDDVLISAAAAMTGALRTTDVLARIGGEEFAVLIPGLTESDTYAMAERLRAAVREGTRLNRAPEIVVTASVGGAFFPNGMPPLEQALTRADGGLYSAKLAGRNRTVMQARPVTA